MNWFFLGKEVLVSQIDDGKMCPIKPQVHTCQVSKIISSSSLDPSNCWKWLSWFWCCEQWALSTYYWKEKSSCCSDERLGHSKARRKSNRNLINERWRKILTYGLHQTDICCFFSYSTVFYCIISVRKILKKKNKN